MQNISIVNSASIEKNKLIFLEKTVDMNYIEALLPSKKVTLFVQQILHTIKNLPFNTNLDP